MRQNIAINDKWGTMKTVSELGRVIIQLAGQGLSRVRFLRSLCEELSELTGSDAVEIRIADIRFMYRYQFKAEHRLSDFQQVKFLMDDQGTCLPLMKRKSALETFCAKLYEKKYQGELKCYYQRKSLIIEEYDSKSKPWKSLAILSFITSEDVHGLIVLSSRQKLNFRQDEAPTLENLAQTVGIAVAFRRSQFSLNERVKELTCLHEISELMNDHRKTEREKFQRIVDMIPPAFQYPQLTSAHMDIDGMKYNSHKMDKHPRHELCNALTVDGITIGEIKVFLKKGTGNDFIDFLPEEVKLMQSISRAVSSMISQTRYNQDRKALEEQLHHADRLATIGQLAAGVAHELNEPLSNILGFAQLAEKSVGDPETVRGDIQKIVKASLHSREIVRKLLLFSRQMPAQKQELELNDLIRENLMLLDNRMRNSGIDIVMKLEDHLPRIKADRAQISQIIINLSVNAMQAMPDGGKLTISTRSTDGKVALWVSDTGTGIAKGIRQKIFLPFFTTKDIGEGTGLGLSVVHGIVMGHNGTISLESEIGRGTTFRIAFPVATKEKDA